MSQFDNGQGGAHTADYYAQYDNTLSNGEARIPICICVDTSRSMDFLTNPDSELIIEESERTVDGNAKVRTARARYSWVKLVHRIDRLQSVLSTMLEKMQKNPIIAKSAVVSIISFDQFADCYVEFTDVNKISTNAPYNLKVGQDQTNVSKGINMALERLDQMLTMNSNAGNDVYKPVLIFMSDGTPTDGRDAEDARIRVRERSEKDRLNVIPISICGNSEGERWLRGLSKESKVYQMTSENEFQSVFAGITERIRRTAMVLPTDETTTNLANQVVDEDTENTLCGEDNSSFLNDFLNMGYNG